MFSDFKLSLGTISLNFWCFAFGWKSGLLCSLVSYAAFIFKRIIFYEYSAKVALVAALVLFWLLVQLFALYLMMQKVGMTFVDAIVMETGNKETLEKLSEGLIFISKDLKRLFFSNRAAIVHADFS